MNWVIGFLLSASAMVALIGYIRVALGDDYEARGQMPLLLIAFILSVGFLAQVQP